MPVQVQQQEQDPGTVDTSSTIQVQVDRLPKSTVRLTVTVPVSEMAPAMSQAFRKVVGRYNIPGFRRGKAPRHIFERFVGPGPIIEEAARNLIDRFYPEALEQAGVTPAQEPRLQLVSADVDEPLVFTAEMGVMPEIELGDYRQFLDAPRAVPEVTEELLEAERREVALRHAEWEVAGEDDPVEMGSRVVVDLVGKLEGQEESFVETQDHVVEVGQGTTLEGLENQLIGGRLGEELTIRLTYPPDYPDASLAGEAAVFQVKIKEHKRRVIPPVDDELAHAEGLEDLDELDEQLTETLSVRLEREATENRLKEILGKLKESVSFEIPDALIQHELLHRVSDMQRTLSQLGADMDQYLRARALTLPALLEELKPSAEERIRDDLLLHALAHAEGVEVTDEEVLEFVRQQAGPDEAAQADAVSGLLQSNDLEGVRESLMLDKVARLVSEPKSA